MGHSRFRWILCHSAGSVALSDRCVKVMLMVVGGA